MDFPAVPSPGRWIGLLLLGITLAAEVAIVAYVFHSGPGPLSAVLVLYAVALVPIAARLAYWVWGSLSLRYRVGRDGIAIRWAASTQVVPMSAITHVLNGRPYAARLRGLHWPGNQVGHTEVATDDGSIRPTLVYASTDPSGQLLVVTNDLAYAISPADRAAFVSELRTRRRLGPVQQLRQETVHAPWLGLSLWGDRTAMRLLWLSVLLIVLSLAWLVWHFPSLPPQLFVSAALVTADGSVTADLRPRGQLWSLPLLGLSAILLNWVLAGMIHDRARVAALLLASGALLVSLALWLVMLGIMR